MNEKLYSGLIVHYGWYPRANTICFERTSATFVVRLLSGISTIAEKMFHENGRVEYRFESRGGTSIISVYPEN
jgi:hypothetical protein